MKNICIYIYIYIYIYMYIYIYVEMYIYLNPSANLVDALWKTQALSTDFKKVSAVSLFSVIIHSV
jgi:hypothetical protein